MRKTTLICRNPDVMGGTPVFCGTRVPVQTLLDYLEAGESIDDFLAGFPSASRASRSSNSSKRQKIACSKPWNEDLSRRLRRLAAGAISSWRLTRLHLQIVDLQEVGRVCKSREEERLPAERQR